VLGVYAIPTAVLAVLARGLFGLLGPRLVYAVVVLACSLTAAPTLHLRSAISAVLPEDYVTAARARGAGWARAVLLHGLRNALLPLVTLTSIEGPTALGGAFVVERVFDLPGLGEATIRAVERRDISWLMALSMGGAALSALFVVLTDVAYALINPRLVPLLVSEKGPT